jgi:hypothetical protein
MPFAILLADMLIWVFLDTKESFVYYRPRM